MKCLCPKWENIERGEAFLLCKLLLIVIGKDLRVFEKVQKKICFSRQQKAFRSKVKHKHLDNKFPSFVFSPLLQVRWMQQQHEKIRKKRDYSTFDQDFVRFPDPRSIAPGSQRVNYRDTGSHNIFPDPLFKEQWYLVSRVCVVSSFYPFAPAHGYWRFTARQFAREFCFWWALVRKACGLQCGELSGLVFTHVMIDY